MGALSKDITVTVVARHGVDADGLDTAIGILGVTRGLALVERRPEAAAFIVTRAEGKPQSYVSERFRALVTPEPVAR